MYVYDIERTIGKRNFQFLQRFDKSRSGKFMNPYVTGTVIKELRENVT